MHSLPCCCGMRRVGWGFQARACRGVGRVSAAGAAAAVPLGAGGRAGAARPRLLLRLLRLLLLLLLLQSMLLGLLLLVGLLAGCRLQCCCRLAIVAVGAGRARRALPAAAGRAGVYGSGNARLLLQLLHSSCLLLVLVLLVLLRQASRLVWWAGTARVARRRWAHGALPAGACGSRPASALRPRPPRTRETFGDLLAGGMEERLGWGLRAAARRRVQAGALQRQPLPRCTFL